jgi:hypothetical protein
MEEEKQTQKELIHDLDSKGKKSTFSLDEKKEKIVSMRKPLIITIAIMLILGVGTGYIATKTSGISKKGPLSISGSGTSTGAGSGKSFGVSDTKAFPDTAEGTLRAGGIDGEGEFHLERPGGDSQNVYMISSAVDLSQFTGKKVKVWGQTQTAQKAGWLMDVGKLEVQ